MVCTQPLERIQIRPLPEVAHAPDGYVEFSPCQRCVSSRACSEALGESVDSGLAAGRAVGREREEGGAFRVVAGVDGGEVGEEAALLAGGVVGEDGLVVGGWAEGEGGSGEGGVVGVVGGDDGCCGLGLHAGEYLVVGRGGVAT